MGEHEKINPLVSVVIPFFNAEATLGKCMESVLNQTYRNLEIILIENGSSDQGKAIAEKYVSADSRVQLIEQGHQTVSVARNAGIARATGKYIQFVDSDDYLEQDAVKKLVQAVEETEKTLVICDYFQFDETQRDMRSVRPLEGTYPMDRFLKKLLRNPCAHYYGVLWNKIYHTSVIRENQITFQEDVSLGEDFIFNLEYLKHMDVVECIPEKLYHYWWKRPGSLSNLEKREEDVIEERLQVYEAYESLFRFKKVYNRYRSLIQYYIVKFYFDQLELLEDRAGVYKKMLYEKCINGTGISNLKFVVFYILKKGKRFLKQFRR